MATLTNSVRVSIPDAAYWTRCRTCSILIAVAPGASDLCWSCTDDVHSVLGLGADVIGAALASTVRRSR